MNLIKDSQYSKDNADEYNINLKIENIDNEERMGIDQNRASLLTHTVRISKELFPSIFKYIDIAVQKLNINESKENINFYIKPDSEINALCYVVPLTNIVDIVFNSRLIELLNDEELSFVAGHELAHYLYQHYLYPKPVSALSDLEYTNLNQLSKSAEISADRLGLISCGNLKFALQAMLKTATGLPSRYINFNFEAYLDQLKDLKNIKNNTSQLYSTHPSILNRVQSLIWFSQSDVYGKIINSQEILKLNISDVDEMINESIKEVIGKEHTRKNQEVYEKFKLWASIKLFLLDGKFQKSEQQIFQIEFGEEKLKNIISFLKDAKKNTLEEKIQEYALEASALVNSDKEKLIKELEIIAGKIEGDERQIIQNLSKLCMLIDLKRSVTIIK